LTAMLAPLGLQMVVQPAFDFRGRDAATEQPEVLADLEGDKAPRLLIFTSPRAVKFGLAQLPHDDQETENSRNRPIHCQCTERCRCVRQCTPCVRFHQRGIA